MKLIEKSCEDFVLALESKAPVPGGGGASAMAAALGIALGNMVGELTVGKKKYADVESDIKALMNKAQILRERLLCCVETDAAAFEPLSRAYAIPKDDPDRASVMEECLRSAAAVPLEILQLCCDAAEVLAEFAEKGSTLVISDAATGAAFCKAAMQGAAINVKVNTKLMGNREYASEINEKVDKMLAKYSLVADKIFENIYGRFC